MEYVRKKEECSGCRACEQICPVNCIVINPDEEGFLYPNIDKKRCINCGKCLDVCKAEYSKRTSETTKNISHRRL